ncbi:uncharacterized protein MELLADRAFT_57309 [Melampsora larici-populina 98AG31]|uniref:CCHC-type domain-containing protein n=1 Tax=Melampsora larici-populina (strain 98AG31 / pathotype 3-4-7) TaxID=747676 RepID=F4S0U9_MELLP|nr:uncharacterized protein MELLADRAFT_57309 [Melampsora larici-populina 98AG31]EGG01652.1 hypothetical protein MELLADRAFT_57309 [Melampsora larici-populina 98AG31]
MTHGFPDQNLDFMLHRLEQDQLQSATSGIEANRATAHHANSSSAKPAGSSVSCTHCKKVGHVEDKCWKKYKHLAPNRNQSRFTQAPTEEPEVPTTANYAGVDDSIPGCF